MKPQLLWDHYKHTKVPPEVHNFYFYDFKRIVPLTDLDIIESFLRGLYEV